MIDATSTIQYRGRAFAARLRSRMARQALANCRLCAHGCGVDRLAGQQGLCRAGSKARVFSAQVEVADELELMPTFAIALAGCDLRCAFCITGRESWNPHAGAKADFAELANEAAQALAGRARTVMILGGEPTIHLPDALHLVSLLPETATLVWKTNAHASQQALELLDGIFDVWLADYKFGNDTCARKLAQAENYERIVRRNLIWASRRSDLIVRHLLMPGHVECCWKPVACWIAENLPGAKVSLQTGFWPGWNARFHAGLNRRTSARETALASAIARDYNLNLIE